MDFKNRIKGSVTQALVNGLLKDAGYQVVPLGIEEVIREIQDLSLEDYINLKVPTPLRTLPDFFVRDPESNESFLIEVKYLKEWNSESVERLGKILKKQASAWNPFFLIILLGNNARDHDTPSSYIGAIKLVLKEDSLFAVACKKNKESGRHTEFEIPWESVNWKCDKPGQNYNTIRRIQDVFPKIAKEKSLTDETLKKTCSILKSLNGLDIFDE